MRKKRFISSCAPFLNLLILSANTHTHKQTSPLPTCQQLARYTHNPTTHPAVAIVFPIVINKGQGPFGLYQPCFGQRRERGWGNKWVRGARGTLLSLQTACRGSKWRRNTASQKGERDLCLLLCFRAALLEKNGEELLVGAGGEREMLEDGWIWNEGGATLSCNVGSRGPDCILKGFCPFQTTRLTHLPPIQTEVAKSRGPDCATEQRPPKNVTSRSSDFIVGVCR